MIRQDMKFDVRTLKHRMRRNEMTQAEIDAELAKIPDEAAESEPTKTEFSARWEGKSAQ